VEIFLVWFKLVVLVGLAGYGIAQWQPELVSRGVPATGPLTALFGAASVFMAYEGFQLLTYDYDDIADAKRNLPRAVHLSIPAVIAIYMLVAFVTTGSLTDDVIARHSETVLAYAARPVVGRIGITAVLVAAVFSTASAINATLFASARLARRIRRDGQLPDLLGRWQSGGISVAFVLGMAAAAILIQATADLGQITAFSSLVFLLVFAVVNAAALPHGVFHGLGLLAPAAGTIGCLAAAGTLVYDLARNEPRTLAIVGGIGLALAFLRGVYLIGRRA
jgi:amino acid transporter